MLEELRFTKDRVKKILEKYPSARDSDKLLFLFYLSEFHQLDKRIGEFHYGILFQILTKSDTPSPECLRRIRQKFQQDGFFMGEKRKKRMEEQERVRAWAREQKKKEQDKIDQMGFF